jgi:CTP:molybdopterin cytidylyltransferase MocA
MARLASERGIAPLAVVVPPGPSPVEEVARSVTPLVVRSERSRLGRTASIQEGLSILPEELDVLLWPVDHSFVKGRTLHDLMEARSSDALGRWFIPKWKGHGGHPVLIGHEVFPAILALRPQEPLRGVLGGLGPQIVTVPVDDPAVAEPVDTPEAYRRACQRALTPDEEPWIDG